jgi:hypothetical protein
VVVPGKVLVERRYWRFDVFRSLKAPYEIPGGIGNQVCNQAGLCRERADPS